ncbi:MAG: 16S rRNA (guanine(527)-N(7))-methyltransferase RsmG [Oscillospiraceae bacterium]|nr:16S rRNA (guanine(527)-N(7))-methyltransferase RsmG [Oscillospiraceae bacterium]
MKKGLYENMVEFTVAQKVLLDKMSDFMLEYNKKVNLTAITEPAQIWEKHYTDSAFPLELADVPCGTSVIDVGTGAGFPGVIWKIYRPDLNLTLLDSLRKRVYYLGLLRERLDLEYSAIHARSEEFALKPDYRESFGVAVSRAVAKLPALCEFCLPLVKTGGLMLAMKGAEVEGADAALKILGGEIEEIKSYRLPSGAQRNLIIIRKIRNTPKEFPRQRVNISNTEIQ